MGCKNNDVAAQDGNRKNLRKIRTIIRKEKLGIRRLSKIAKNSITSDPFSPSNILAVAERENSVSFWHIAIRISIICKENGKHIVTLCSWLFFPLPIGGCLHHPASLPAVIGIPPQMRTPQSIGSSKQSDVKQQSEQQLRQCTTSQSV